MEDIEMKQLAGDLELGLRRLGPDRAVALSVHKTKELIAELQEKAALLVRKLDKQG
tara:strand:+ start:252 stop:419 length:168 start_codon:yes stop_codon:yes gene_type:complete